LLTLIVLPTLYLIFAEHPKLGRPRLEQAGD
jgi:hypothetical protein